MPGELPPAPAAALPDGFAVRLEPATRRLEGGAALLGGAPLRLLRLSPRALALLDGDRLVVRDPASAALAGRLLDAGIAAPEPTAGAGGPGDGVTVVVPVRDRAAPTARLLAALRADPDTRALPVLLVDDGSADPAALAAVAAGGGARVLRTERSRGPAAARNTGMRAAGTDLVAFLDSDCVPRPGWLRALRAHLADPRVAVVAPRIVALEPSAGGCVGSYEAAVSALDMGPRPALVRPLSPVSYLPSAALLARRAALGGGFDEAMPVAEDVDLVWRLHAAGWRVRYEPGAAVAHEHPTTTSRWLSRRFAYGTGAAPLAARHGAAVSPVVVAPWSALFWGLALATGRRHPWPGPLAAGAVLALRTARLAGRLAGSGPPPVLLSARLVLDGAALSGRTLARAVTRHHWPLAVVAGVASPPLRRRLLAVAGVDALVGWWPHRMQVGPLRFAAGRRLEDLAYGAGLWAGAARARDPRALLPAAPPRSARPGRRDSGSAG